MGVVLLMAVLLMGGCSSSDELDPNAPVPTVTAQLNFSLPSRIVNKKSATRMTGGIVQESQQEADFRGITDVQMLCFNEEPTITSNKLGGMIDIRDNELNDSIATENDYSLCQQIDVPVGTTHFEFYASAPEDFAEDEDPTLYPTQHEKRMHFGAIEAVGLAKNTYHGNSGIRFRPVLICPSTDELGGSPKGHALLNLLNDLMGKLNPAGNLYLNEAYQRMTELTTLSSYNVQVMLGFILKLINQEAPDNQGSQSVADVTDAIIRSCAEDNNQNPIADIANGVIELKEAYQGFPADINLPDGAARIKWNETQQLFVIPDKQIYSNDLQVTSVNDYVYPINLQYQVSSEILASDDLVVLSTNEDGDVVEPSSAKYTTWEELITKGYDPNNRIVEPTTQSVAMLKKVQYAVGRLAVQSRLGDDAYLNDANGNSVYVANHPFTLKGYIVGSQREVDYDFQPVTTSRTYAIYDTDLNGGPQVLQRHYFTPTDYILGLGTPPDQSILVALELVNNGQDFQGADGVIVKGATFYLVANMNPKEDGNNYKPGELDQIFCKDLATQVYITINSLKDATYGLPNLDIPRPTLGLSVDLRWEEGLWFPDIPL